MCMTFQCDECKQQTALRAWRRAHKRDCWDGDLAENSMRCAAYDAALTALALPQLTEDQIDDGDDGTPEQNAATTLGAQITDDLLTSMGELGMREVTIPQLCDAWTALHGRDINAWTAARPMLAERATAVFTAARRAAADRIKRLRARTDLALNWDATTAADVIEKILDAIMTSLGNDDAPRAHDGYPDMTVHMFHKVWDTGRQQDI